jgi:hypothetical protein
MSDIRQVQRLELGLRELVIIDNASDQMIHCESGELWITQDGDRRDIIVPAEKSWRIDADRPLVVSALKPAVATLTHTQPGRMVSVPRRQGAESLLALIRRWRFPTLASFPATRIV